MNFVKFSTSYEYLHSPKNWLHFHNSKMKLTVTLVQLACLVVISLKYIFIVFIISLLACKSLAMPEKLKKYFYKSIALFAFFLLISIKKYSILTAKEFDSRRILQIYPFNYFNKKNIAASRQSNSSFFYLPESLLRLTSIHLIYLILTRCLLLTTKHEDIVKTALMHWRTSQDYSGIKFIFTVMTSSQFLRIIFEQIETIRISYMLRSININRINNLKLAAAIFISFSRELISNIGFSISTVACTLYSRDIVCSNLNMYN